MESAKAEKRSCFSLIELMLVVSIILILTTLSVSSLNNSRRQARQVYCTNNMRQIAIAIQMYQQDYKYYPTTERFLDNFLPVYSYVKSLDVFACPGNPNTVRKIASQNALVGGTDYCFWSGQLSMDLPASSSTTTTNPDNGSTTTTRCSHCNRNVCTCDRGNGNGNNGGNGTGHGNGHGNGNGNNGGNGNGNGGGGSTTTPSTSGGSSFYAYGADISDTRFQRVLADKLSRPVLYDKCGPAHGNYINVCDIRDASVTSQRDMCALWVLDSSGNLILDSIEPFPK